MVSFISIAFVVIKLKYSIQHLLALFGSCLDFYSPNIVQSNITEILTKGSTLANILLDTGRKWNVHKTFRRCLGRLHNVLFTFNLPPVSTGTTFALKIFRRIRVFMEKRRIKTQYFWSNVNEICQNQCFISFPLSGKNVITFCFVSNIIQFCDYRSQRAFQKKFNPDFQTWLRFWHHAYILKKLS